MTTQFDYLTLNIIFNFIKHQMEWHVTKGKYEIKLPFYMLLSINNLPVKLKKERKSEIAEKTSQSLFQLPYQKFSSPPHLWTPTSLRSPPRRHEVHRPCEDHRACEIPRPCEVSRPCEVHRVGGLLRKSTTPKHRKVPSLCCCVNANCLGFSSEMGFLTSKCSPFAGYSSIWFKVWFFLFSPKHWRRGCIVLVWHWKMYV